MTITLTGENNFAIRQAVRDLVARFGAKYGAHGVERVDGEALESARLPDLLQGTTLFAPSRLVIIENISANKALHEPLLALLPSVPSDTTVLIVDSKLDKRTKLYTFLKTKTKFQDFASLGAPQLAKWASGMAKELGGELGQTEAQYLVDRIGHDQWTLQHEIEKLVSYEPRITRVAIDELVEPTPQASAFELLDATLAGNSDKAQRLLNQLRTAEDPYKFFGLLASQIHALAIVAAAGQRATDVIAKDAGLHPFVVRKTQSVATRLNKKQLQQMVTAAALCDTQLKSTGADPWRLIANALNKIARI